MTMEIDNSKYLKIANQTKTIEVNGEKVQIRTQTDNTEQWAQLSNMHSQVNSGDTYFCTDGYDDGEITGTEKGSLFAEGMWDSTKDKAIPTAIAAGAAVGIKAAAGTAVGTAIAGTTVGAAVIAAAPVVLGVAAVIGGIYLIGKGISSFSKASEQAKNATTDAEAKAAWKTMGESTVDTAYGVAVTTAGVKSLNKQGVFSKIKNDVKNLFSRTPKGTNTLQLPSGSTNKPQLPSGSGSSADVEIIDAPKSANTNVPAKAEPKIIDVEYTKVDTGAQGQIPSGKNVIELGPATGSNVMYDGYTNVAPQSQSVIELGPATGSNSAYSGLTSYDTNVLEYDYTLFDEAAIVNNQQPIIGADGLEYNYTLFDEAAIVNNQQPSVGTDGLEYDYTLFEI